MTGGRGGRGHLFIEKSLALFCINAEWSAKNTYTNETLIYVMHK